MVKPRQNRSYLPKLSVKGKNLRESDWMPKARLLCHNQVRGQGPFVVVRPGWNSQPFGTTMTMIIADNDDIL
jgi:hypothetical protein